MWVNFLFKNFLIRNFWAKVMGFALLNDRDGQAHVLDKAR